ncbi:MAG: TrmH family RNA methyltransferase [Rikenella sp.]|nr:TrmH family RNA methyltransferase [Rikenella sp.]
MRKITNEELGRPTPEAFATQRRLPLTVVLDNVRSANNTGAFFRTGDAFGIERLVLCGITATPPSRDIHKSALGAELTVSWEYETESTKAVERLRNEGYTVLAVEQVRGAVSLECLDLSPFGEKAARFALVFGNEVEGVQQEVVDLCDGAIEIPQVGTKHSLNVAVSGGVVLWEFFKRLHRPR